MPELPKPSRLNLFAACIYIAKRVGKTTADDEVYASYCDALCTGELPVYADFYPSPDFKRGHYLNNQKVPTTVFKQYGQHLRDAVREDVHPADISQNQYNRSFYQRFTIATADIDAWLDGGIYKKDMEALIADWEKRPDKQRLAEGLKYLFPQKADTSSSFSESTSEHEPFKQTAGDLHNRNTSKAQATAAINEVPNLLYYWNTDFPNFMRLQREITIVGKTSDALKEPLVVKFHIYQDHASNTKFLGFYIPPSENIFQVCLYLGESCISFMDDLGNSVLTATKNPGDLASMPSHELTFSRRVYIYHETELSLEQLGILTAQFRERKLYVQFRCRHYATNSWLQGLVNPNPPASIPDEAKMSSTPLTPKPRIKIKGKPKGVGAIDDSEALKKVAAILNAGEVGGVKTACESVAAEMEIPEKNRSATVDRWRRKYRAQFAGQEMVS